MLTQKQWKKLDIFLFIVFPLIAVVISLTFKVNFLISTILFFGIPSLWLSYRTPNEVKKTAIFSILFSIPLAYLLDTFAVINNIWYVNDTAFSFRILGIIPLEQFAWAFLVTYCVVIFYEHFIQKGKYELVDKRMKYFLWPIIIIMIIYTILFLQNKAILLIPYAYLIGGIIVLVIPVITFSSLFPRLFSSYVKVWAYFFIVFFLNEITALQLNYWTFPGTQYIGWVNFFGYKMPFEEFFYFFIILSIMILSYYEFFDEDPKKSKVK